jgi:hypothetical protein
MKILDARVKDKNSYIEVKDVIVARSGIYRYSRAEVEARGYKPSRVKDYYYEFRPAAVIAAAVDLFNLVPVPNKEHVDSEIDQDNFSRLASAIIGGPLSIVPMPNGIDIGIQGKIKFFTKDAYNYYQAGNKETSADYVSKSVLVDNPDEVGYDLLMTEISSVNNVAITAMGRGGKDVRIKDSSVSSGNFFDMVVGRKDMGMLTKLWKPSTAGEQKLSAIVKDSLLGLKGATPEKREQLVDAVMDRVSEVSESSMRSGLTSVVRDSFTHPEDALEHWKDTEKIIDGLYARCQDADAALAAQVLDSKTPEKKGEEEEKGEGDGKKGGKAHEAAESKEKEDEEEEKKKKEKEKSSREKDSAAALIDEKIGALKSELPDLITASIKKALNLDGGKGGTDSRVLDSVDAIKLDSDDASFALDGVFGTGRV